MTDREKKLELALLLMVYQYCTVNKQFYDTGRFSDRQDKAVMFNNHIVAGEQAFEVLGINNGDADESVWERIEKLEAELN